MLKIALVGVGGISGAHIPAWESMDDAELVAICDIRPERMDNYPDKRPYTDFDEMLEKEEISENASDQTFVDHKGLLILERMNKILSVGAREDESGRYSLSCGIK